MADFANGKLNFSGTGLGSSFAQSFPKYGALHFRFPSADYYVSDEWAVSKSIKLTYGLRIEEDLNPSCIENCFVLTNVPFDSPSYQGGASIPYNTTIQTKSNLFYKAEKAIVQPRVGIAWKPFGSEKTVIRAGVGLFSTNYTDGIGGTFANQIPNKFAPGGLNFGNVGLAGDSTSSAYAAQASANAFFSGFGAGYTLAQIQNAVKPATFGTPSIVTSPAVYQAPKDIEWSFEIQHALTSHNMLTASYVANHGYNLAETVNDNAYAAVNATFTSRYGATYGGLPTAAPDPRFVTVTQYYNNGVSNYNSLTFTYRHTTSFGLNAQVHYTWSHTLGTVAFENPLNLQGSYGNLGFDNRHQVAGDLLWTSPRKFQSKVLNAVTGGWIFASKLYLYSGAPFTPTDSKIPAQINSAGGILTPIADLLVSSALSANCGKAAVNAPCLPKTDFATYLTTSGVGTRVQTDWGNISPGQFRGPGYFDIDTNVARNFAIREKWVLNLGLQAYNVLNHANFANPSGTLSSGSFAQITSTLGPPTSIYGTGQGAAVSGRLMVVTGRFTF
jgi:hypothetical protein